MPLLTKEPWFGPKQVAGWGLRPLNWKGWALIAVVVVLVVLDIALLRGTGHARLGAAGIVVLGVAAMAGTATRQGGRG